MVIHISFIGLPISLLLHRSPYLYHQDVLSIARSYLELSHLVFHISQLASGSSAVRPQPSISCSSGRTIQTMLPLSRSTKSPGTMSTWTGQQDRGSGMILSGYSTRPPLQEDVELTADWLAKLYQHLSGNPELIWLCESSGLPSILIRSNESNSPQTNKLKHSMMRLQILCSIVALHCIDLCLTKDSNCSTFMTSLAYDLRGATPSLLMVAS